MCISARYGTRSTRDECQRVHMRTLYLDCGMVFSLCLSESASLRSSSELVMGLKATLFQRRVSVAHTHHGEWELYLACGKAGQTGSAIYIWTDCGNRALAALRRVHAEPRRVEEVNGTLSTGHSLRTSPDWLTHCHSDGCLIDGLPCRRHGQFPELRRSKLIHSWP